MATIKSYTDLEQSKKLAEILPLESADYTRLGKDESNVLTRTYFESCSSELKGWIGKNEMYPCWSLAALRNLLPPAIKPNKESYLFLFESHNTFDESWVYRYCNEDGTSYLYCKNTNEVDACYEMIIKLKEKNLI